MDGQRAMMKQRILFLAANPAGSAPHKLEEEARAIEEKWGAVLR